MSDQNKREYYVVPLEFCYFDRKRFDIMRSSVPLKIVSFRKYSNGVFRVHFVTKPEKEPEETRSHLLWIQLLTIDNVKYVKYRCDCKYFEYRLIRAAKRLFDVQTIQSDACVVVPSKAFSIQKKLFNIDKHAFLALKELFNIHVKVTI